MFSYCPTLLEQLTQSPITHLEETLPVPLCLIQMGQLSHDLMYVCMLNLKAEQLYLVRLSHKGGLTLTCESTLLADWASRG